ncbi:hypothetical protein [Paenibacillus jamilae]|uniref:hypothetical protein n=1 Tax=Paenibacillus jamilae TaxID=114136 RepID=UPI0015F32220|nr:hypothetical protein [Paenibacillus jamilae]
MSRIHSGFTLHTPAAYAVYNGRENQCISLHTLPVGRQPDRAQSRVATGFIRIIRW